MTVSLKPDKEPILKALKCVCPRCGQGKIFKNAFSIKMNESCSECGLSFKGEDSADGPAVFLIFVLGFLIVPLALGLEFIVKIPLWAHVIIWGIAIFLLTFFSMRPLKAYVLALQYKYRKDDLEK